MTKPARPLLLAVAIMGMVLALSLQMQPGKHMSSVSFFYWDYWFDTLRHFLGYVIIGAAYYLGLKWQPADEFSSYARVVWPVVAFGALTELLQLAIPTRSCNFYDLLANTLGPLTGYLLVRAYAGLAGIPRPGSLD